MVEAIAWRYATLIGLASTFYLFYNLHPYYQTDQFAFARVVSTYVYFAYLIVGLPLYAIPLIRNPRSRFAYRSKTLIYMVLVRRLGRVLFRIRPPRWFLGSLRCRVALLSLIVKGYYLPVMIMFLGSHLQGLAHALHTTVMAQDAHSLWMDGYYELIFHALFALDTSIFTVGYALESNRLGSRIKSVEPTLFGWAVTLACYPPFQSVTSLFLPSHPAAHPWVTNPALLDVLRVMRLGFYGIFVWASVALGFKASNLTNRGIVHWGPYRWSRHPAYAAKLLAFWCEELPHLTVQGALSLIGWNLIYVFRALTEERHLLKDPDYHAYCKRVRCRFIPGLM